MNRQALIDKLEQEYGQFTDRMAMLSPREIIARADVIAGMHYVLEYIKSDDFDISDVSVDIAAINVGEADGLLDDLYESFRFEMDDIGLHDDIINSLDLVLGNLQYAQQSDFHEHYASADDEDEDEMEL